METQKSYQNGPDGAVSSTEQKVVRPDGSSETTWRQEWSGAVPAPYMPPPPPYGSSTTTTTTVR